MRKKGLKLAIKYGNKRRQFANHEAAIKYYETLRSDVLSIVHQLKKEYPIESLDYSPVSLKSIEKIYFDYFENDKFSGETISKDEFEILLAIYYGEVYVHNEKQIG